MQTSDAGSSHCSVRRQRRSDARRQRRSDARRQRCRPVMRALVTAVLGGRGAVMRAASHCERKWRLNGMLKH